VKIKLSAFFAFEPPAEHTSVTEAPMRSTNCKFAQQAGLAAQPAAVIPTPFYENRYNARLDYKVQ